MEEQMREEELDNPVPATQETLKKARQDFTKLGLWLVFATIVFNGMQILAKYVWSNWIIPRFTTEELSKGIFAYKCLKYWIVLLPTYLIAVPLILCFGKKLLPETVSGTVLEKRGVKPKQFAAALACTFGIAITCNIVGLIITFSLGKNMGREVENVSVDLIASMDLWTSIFLTSIGAPICEELMFRKMLVTRTRKYGEGVAILLSGLSFGLFHGNFNQFAYAFGIGMFFAYVFLKTGNIKITIALHACMNAFTSVVLAGLMNKLDVNKLGELAQKALTGGQESEAFAAYFQFLAENSVLIVAIGLCVLFEYGFALFGLVFLIVNLKKLRVNAGEVTIPKGKRFFTIFCNVGMILFFAVWIFMIVAQIMGWH